MHISIGSDTNNQARAQRKINGNIVFCIGPYLSRIIFENRVNIDLLQIAKTYK